MAMADNCSTLHNGYHFVEVATRSVPTLANIIAQPDSHGCQLSGCGLWEECYRGTIVVSLLPMHMIYLQASSQPCPLSHQTMTPVVRHSRARTVAPVSTPELARTSVCAQRSMKERTALWSEQMNATPIPARMEENAL